MAARSASRHPWTYWHAVALLGLTALGVFGTWDAWCDIVRIASRDEESSHVWLVPAIAGWLVWRRRGRLRRCAPSGLLVGSIVIILGTLLYIVGAMWLIQSPWHAGAVMVLIGCLISVLGKEVLYEMAPAFAVLIFLVPVPGRLRQQISIPLEGITAALTQTCCDLFGVPVERAGMVLRVNGADVTIDEACNGLRMIFSLTLVCYTIAFSAALKGYIRLGMLIASPLLAIVFNVLRLIVLVWLYGHYPMQTANRFHDISGWLMAPAALVVVLLILRTLRWAMIPVSRFTLAHG